MLGEPDIVPEWCKSGTVELHTGVDAVVSSAIRRQAATIVGVDLVQGEAGPRSLGSASSRATEAAVVEGHTYRPISCDRQVGLELIDRRRIVVDLKRSTPRETAIGGGGEEKVIHACAEVLPGHIERVMTLCGQVVAHREGVLDPISEGRVRVDQRRCGDVVGDR